jgi:purine-nucleoside phosphorylase
MSKVPTPHIAATKEQIARVVLMPGDPLRAKWIAETFLDEAVCFNEIRNMLGYTGKYKETEVSVMGSGMGVPSMGIYSYELFNFYDVDAIIRIGSAGAIHSEIALGDVMLAMGACTNTNFAQNFDMPGTMAPIADFKLLSVAAGKAEEAGVHTRIGNVLTSDVFYNDAPSKSDLLWAKMNVLAVEMEAAGLYLNAARTGKRALCIATISDQLVHGECLSVEERERSFSDMVKIGLETAIEF